ncbi:MAG: PilZ domain-containing protein [Pseudomonadota bacterium]
MAEDKERRESLRIKCDHTITFSILKSEGGRLRDISEGGARIKTDRRIMEQKEVELFIPVEESSIIARGRVAHIKKLEKIYDVGIDFTEIDEGKVKTLMEFFKLHSLSEMRQDRRLPADYSISFCHHEMGAGKLRDLSESGVKIKSHRPFQLAGEVEMFFPLEERSIIAKGRVSRVQKMGDLYDVGITFTEIEKEHKEALLEFFKKNRPEEMRRFPRLLCDQTITYSYPGMGSGKLLDLSKDGLRVKTHDTFQSETEVDISIPLEGRFIVAKGRIARVQKAGDLYDVGISFTEIYEENRQALLDYFQRTGRREMRQSPRMPAFLSVSYSGQGTGAGKMLDLSESGVKIKTSRPFELETDVEMFLPVEKDYVIAKGRVSRVKRVGNQYDVGIFFTEINEENKQLLLDFFKRRHS